MNWINVLSQNLEVILGIDEKYINLTLLTIIAYIIYKLAKAILAKITIKAVNDPRKKYNTNRRIQITLGIIFTIVIMWIWEAYITQFITLISFITAGVTIALKEVIANFFGGIYIKIAKPFELEDRIEIKGVKGDIVNINMMSFEILEIGDRVNSEQSTGRIVHIPNLVIFTDPVKNYVKAFKYIWDEFTVKIPADSDIDNVKEILYRIMNSNELIKSIPKKMEDQIEDASLEYRLYFNNFRPIVYSELEDNHINLYMRYLVHPKQTRIVQNEITEEIIKAANEKEIILFEEV